MSGPGRDGVTRAVDLVRLFHADPATCGRFFAAAADSLPAGPRRLLDHRGHMTEAIERFYRGPVSLRVVGRREDAAGRYAREILLDTQAGHVVQHGIVRIDLNRLAPTVAAAIRGERTPLGRILMEAGLLCVVDDVGLLRIEPGPTLRSLFDDQKATVTFGRVAEILVDEVPAIELLETIAPDAGR
ncbi:MAG: hypothetical protein FJ284_09890 [Planctomycetes bacterium]|nr:hypothetical protein [Planctomycetota bacterium]